MTAHGYPAVKEAIAGVEGWLTDEEGQALYSLARECTGRGSIVEIGSFKGRSTICLALGSREGRGVRVYAVDTHYGPRLEEFNANIERAGVADLVEPVAGRSQEVALDFDEPVELLFIDGAHDYDSVLEDFERWVPKLVEGGVVAMHDTTWDEGPKRVAEQLILRSPAFKDVRFVVGSTTVGRKATRTSRADRLRSRYVLAVKRSFELGTTLARSHRNLLPKPLERGARKLYKLIAG
jgi:predicted O-methyltransferase YrrM